MSSGNPTRQATGSRRVVDISTADINFSGVNGPGHKEQAVAATDAIHSIIAAAQQQSAPSLPGEDPLLGRQIAARAATAAASCRRSGAFLFGSKDKPLAATGSAPAANAPPPWARRPAAPSGAGAPQLSSSSSMSALSAADALMSASATETPMERSLNFQAKVRQYYSHLLAVPSSLPVVTRDVDQQVLSCNVPLWRRLCDNVVSGDPNPWDTELTQQMHNLVHHPHIPVHPATADELDWEQRDENRCLKLVKTTEELRAERRRAAAAKREETQKAIELQKKSASKAGVVALHQDKLKWKNLNDACRVGQLAVDPQGLHDEVTRQYQERFEKHQLLNYERHAAAVPHQIEKKIADLWRHAEETPRLQAYRIPKARNPDCINRLRNFANDVKLRGFLLWICEEEVIIVLAGGDVALRHLDRWICDKMDWHRPQRAAQEPFLQKPTDAHKDVPSTDAHKDEYDEGSAKKVRRVDPSLLERTRGELIASVPLMRVGDVTFLLPRKPVEEVTRHRKTSRHEESVYVRHADTVNDAAAFLCSEMPAGGIFSSLDFIWRAAYPMREHVL